MITIQYFSSATTLGAPSKPVEVKIPLYWCDGTYYSTSTTTANYQFLAEGGGASTSATYSSVELHTLSSKWPAGTKFAFEATLYVSSTSYTGTATLYDSTGAAQVASSQISTTSSTAVVTRSGQFTLTPGHIYSVSAWTNGGYVYLVDASLIVFP